MSEQRYYSSNQYLLPSDNIELARLNLQHQIMVKSFGDVLALAPQTLTSGDCILESAAGSGIWALEFSEQNRDNGTLIDIECIDITDRMFPKEHPPNIHFSLHSVLHLPLEWTNKFSYIHQRFLVWALRNESLWMQALAELFRVLAPGKWIELVEGDLDKSHFGIGPNSKKFFSLIKQMSQFPDTAFISSLSDHLVEALKKGGFEDVHVERRHVSIGGRSQSLKAGGSGYSSSDFMDVYMALKTPVLKAGGYGIVKTEDEFDSLLKSSAVEWDCSEEAYAVFFTIVAKKPDKRSGFYTDFVDVMSQR